MEPGIEHGSRMKSIEIRARTVAEAVRLALLQLDKDHDEVAIAILDQGNEEEEALVRVSVVDDDDDADDVPADAPPATPAPRTGQRGLTRADDADQVARRILEDILERMEIEAFVSAVRSTVPDQRGEPEETLTLHVEGADEEAMGLLIGRHGDTLRSLQFVVNLLMSRRVQKWPQIVVDVGNYRQRRQESLEGMARRMADRVRQSGRPMQLEPMGSFERRVIHLVLRADPTVYTESTGEGENRKIVIFPAKA